MFRKRRIANPFFSKIEGSRMADFRILSSDVKGRVNFQGAAVAYADEIRGLAVGGGSCTKLTVGMQAGAIVGTKKLAGLLVGALSVAHELAGGEISAVISAARRAVRAFQAGFFCITDSVDKFLVQIGIVNMAHELAPGAWALQIGALNFIDGKMGFPLFNLKISKNHIKKGI